MTTCEQEETQNQHVKKPDIFAKNRAEEPALIQRWVSQKDPKALHKLINNYKPMFGQQIKQILAGRSVNRQHTDDLMQECTLAFIQAIELYEQDRSVTLGTFAQPKIRGALMRYTLDFRSSYRIGKGSDERKAYYAAQKLRSKKAGMGDGTISEQDIVSIAKSTGSSMKATRRAVESTQTSQTTLEEDHENLVSADHGEQYIQTSAHDRAMEEVNAFLKGVSDRNREIIQRSFLSGSEPSNVDLSQEYDLTPERIGQIKRKMLRGLAKHLVRSGIDVEDVL